MTSSKERMEQFKQFYGQFFNALYQLLDKHDQLDPVKKMIPGAGKTAKYELELILLRINEASSAETFGRIIFDAVARCSGYYYPPERALSAQWQEYYTDLGKIAWNAWRRWREEMQLK